MIATSSDPFAAIVQRLQAKRSGSGFMAKCPAHDDRNPSLSIKEGEDGRVLLHCHSGCSVQNIVTALGLSMKDLFPADKLGAFSFNPSPREIIPPLVIPRMPESVSKGWWEGVDYLWGQPQLLQSLATFRHWPVGFAQHLSESLAISMPRYGNKRAIAFLVVAPEGSRGDMRTRPVGYHLRLPKGCKVPWLYRPNENQDGQAIPALPFILGNFDTARLLIIAEGEWDIVTFGLAAGWLGDGCVLPEGVGLIGVRGAGTTEVFLRYYRPYWPKDVNCLVIPDGDTEGQRWYTGTGSFVSKLKPICRKVAVVHCAAGAKDFNELYASRPVGPQEIRDLLKTHGMALGSEVEP